MTLSRSDVGFIFVSAWSAPWPVVREPGFFLSVGPAPADSDCYRGKTAELGSLKDKRRAGGG